MVASFIFLVLQEDDRAGYQSIIVFISFSSTGIQGPAHVREVARGCLCCQWMNQASSGGQGDGAESLFIPFDFHHGEARSCAAGGGLGHTKHGSGVGTL